ncbi:hypothetical protein GCM10009563_02300 [Subtercola frigoramans]
MPQQPVEGRSGSITVVDCELRTGKVVEGSLDPLIVGLVAAELDGCEKKVDGLFCHSQLGEGGQDAHLCLCIESLSSRLAQSPFEIASPYLRFDPEEKQSELELHFSKVEPLVFDEYVDAPRAQALCLLEITTLDGHPNLESIELGRETRDARPHCPRPGWGVEAVAAAGDGRPGTFVIADRRPLTGPLKPRRCVFERDRYRWRRSSERSGSGGIVAPVAGSRSACDGMLLVFFARNCGWLMHKVEVTDPGRECRRI